jgi:hypothetical protein
MTLYLFLSVCLFFSIICTHKEPPDSLKNAAGEEQVVFYDSVSLSVCLSLCLSIYLIVPMSCPFLYLKVCPHKEPPDGLQNAAGEKEVVEDREANKQPVLSLCLSVYIVLCLSANLLFLPESLSSQRTS